MKTIGLLGGMSWESTVVYYKTINQTIKEQLGDLYSAKILLYSFEFNEIADLQTKGDWDQCAELLSTQAKNLETAGANFIIICTNTMHKLAPQIQEQISIPLVHIAEVTAQHLIQQKIKKVALLGTRYTMTQDFYKNKIIESGVEVLIPNDEDISHIHRIIYEELCQGHISPSSKKIYLDIIGKLIQSGAEGVILGCTEIGLLIQQQDLSIPVFDTTIIHAKESALLALK